MKQSYGFNCCKPGKVLRLIKALDGTCQAKQRCFCWLKCVLIEDGWVQAECVPAKFMFVDGEGTCLMVVYIDNGIIAGPHAFGESAFAKPSSGRNH